MRDPILGLPDPGWYGNRAFSAFNGNRHYMLSTTKNSNRPAFLGVGFYMEQALQEKSETVLNFSKRQKLRSNQIVAVGKGKF